VKPLDDIGFGTAHGTAQLISIPEVGVSLRASLEKVIDLIPELHGKLPGDQVLNSPDAHALLKARWMPGTACGKMGMISTEGRITADSAKPGGVEGRRKCRRT
jgi:hypothetical protein